MSDDVPFLFADEIVRRVAPRRRVVFLSAMSAPQMQQYRAACWEVIAGPGFQAAAEIDLAAVPAATGGEDQLAGADLISLEAPTWPADARIYFPRWKPHAIKVNAAFHGVEDAKCEDIASTLTSLGYTVLACHWRDDNIYLMRSVGRIDHLASFGLPDWKRTNLIAIRDAEFVRVLLTVARLYIGEERRIADLKLGHSARGDHIARLEDAMMTLQKRTPAA